MKKQVIAALAACSATLLCTGAAQAQDHYIGEVMLTAASFCPRDFAEADDRLMSISQNAALLSLLGVSYGGNGTTNFSLADLRGRAAIGSAPEYCS